MMDHLFEYANCLVGAHDVIKPRIYMACRVLPYGCIRLDGNVGFGPTDVFE